jgi:hypothetical protein
MSGCVNFTQAWVRVEDVNDNAPVFGVVRTVRIDLAEDFPIHKPFFTVRAVDRDHRASDVCDK